MVEEKKTSQEEQTNFEQQVKDQNYTVQQPKPGQEKLPQELDEKTKKAMEKTREDLEKLKKEFIKKHNYIRAIGILDPRDTPKFAEEEFDPVTQKEQFEKVIKLIHLVVIIPEDKFKKIKEIRAELVKIADIQKQKVWIHVMSHVDVFNYGLDGKFEFTTAIGMSYPLYDKDFLSSLRVAEYHKMLVLRKFERYIVSYVIGGSFVRGEAIKTSDVDTYVIIDDTDVKRMSRLELKEKLRGWIHTYVSQASEMAGVKNLLSVQVYLLTEFWEAVKDSHPVMFTFIRDGIPLYDRGTFMPWKLLLKMGKLKPSPEAIDMFMSSGDKLNDIVKRRLLDIAVGDIYFSIITPTQALIMLYGLPPPTTKETPVVVKEIFYEKEKMLEKKYVDFIERVIKLYKGYEHQKVNEVSGKEIDELISGANDYLKRLKELREQIEKGAQNKTVKEIHDEVFKVLSAIFGENEEAKLAQLFEKELVGKGMMNPKHITVMKDILKIKHPVESKGKKDNKTGLTRQQVEDVRKDAALLIKDLVEYRQREELSKADRGRFKIKTDKGEIYELIITADNEAFLIDRNGIKKVADKIQPSNEKELSEAITKKIMTKEMKLNHKIFQIIEKELGNFEVSI